MRNKREEACMIPILGLLVFVFVMVLRWCSVVCTVCVCVCVGVCTVVFAGVCIMVRDVVCVCWCVLWSVVVCCMGPHTLASHKVENCTEPFSAKLGC